ncbi:MAG: response regulator [Methanomicrobiales archaeon]|nr:response regulator [Methanomicrobiales archaeon]
MTGFRVFIVEDEAIVADDLRGTLQSLGYTVAGTAHAGETAVEQVLDLQPDLVLMDIHLAGEMDGIETVQEIHKVSSVPVIYLTAYADPALLDRAKVTGPYGYLIKPYNERELHSVIEMARYKSGLDQKLKESEARLQKLNEELEERVAARTVSLRHQLDFLQQLIDTIPAPVYYKNARAEYLGCNNAFEAYTGIPKRSIIGRSDTALFPQDISILSGEKDSQLLGRTGIQAYQVKFPHADHTLRDVIFKKATFHDPGGAIAGFIGVIIDVTDRIHAEEALQASEQRLMAVVGDLSEPVFRAKPDRTCMFANPAFLHLFGLKENEVLGFVFALPFHPEDAPRVREHMASLTPACPAGTITCRVILPKNREHSFCWNIRAFFDSSGQVIEYQYVGQPAGAR